MQLFNHKNVLNVHLEGVITPCTPGEAMLIAEMANAVAISSMPDAPPRLEIHDNLFELKPLAIKHPTIRDPFAFFIELMREEAPLLFCYSSVLEPDRQVMSRLRDAIHFALVRG